MFHKTVHDVESELIQSWADDGWCTGIWGITPEDIASYNVDLYVVDEAPIFPDLPFGGLGKDGLPEKPVYEDDSLLSFNLFLTLAVFLLLGSMGLFYFALRCHTRRNEEDKDESFDDDQFISNA